MKKYATSTLSALLLVVALALTVAAQGGQQPAQGQEQQARAEYDAYMAAYNAFNTEKNMDKALGAAKDYLAKYPSGKYAGDAKSLVTASQDALFGAAFQKNDFEKAFTIVKEMLEANPNEVVLLYRAVVTGNYMAKLNKWNNAADTMIYAEKARQALESGTKPATIADDKWPAMKNQWLADVYQTMGLVANRDKKSDEAIAHLTKAGELNPTDPITFYVLGTLYNNRLVTVSDAYNKLPEDQKVSDAGKAALENVNKEADLVIDTFARVMALTEGKPDFQSIRSQVQPSLETWYKFRHEANPTGWQELVNKYKAANSQPPAQK